MARAVRDMSVQADLARSLEQLDGDPWGEPDDSATGLVRACHRLRTVQIGTLADDDLRLLLGQKIGTPWLIPLALDRLRDNPLAGDSHAGDLLDAVLLAGAGYWDEHPTETMSLWFVRAALDRLQVDAAQLLGRDDWPAFG